MYKNLLTQKIILPIFSFSFSIVSFAQDFDVSGMIVDKNTNPIVGAVVSDSTNHLHATSDENGLFKFRYARPDSVELFISMDGYIQKQVKSSTNTMELIQLDEIEYIKEQSSSEILIQAQKPLVEISSSAIKIETLSSKLLNMQPTNNLMEAITVANGVQEQINCGVCGTNDIHINGMEGPYTLVLIDGMPIMGSLSSVYGLNGIPTSMIERIEITKGPGTVAYGSESVGGILNVITKKPNKAPRLFFNYFGTSSNEHNADLSVAGNVGKWSSLVGLNLYKNEKILDKNQDGYTDIPLTDKISFYNRWSNQSQKYGKHDIVLKYYYEDRWGGQKNWTRNQRGSDSIWAESIFTNRYDFIGSWKLPTSKNLRLDYSWSRHHQNSYYGINFLDAIQKIGFVNFYYQNSVNKHNFKWGTSVRYNEYTDNTTVRSEPKNVMPAAYIEDELTLSPRLLLMPCYRIEYRTQHGIIHSPRFNVKWTPFTAFTTRFNSGTGFRSVNIFTEEHAALTGSRTVLIKQNLKPERSYNFTLSNSYTLPIRNGIMNLNADAFYVYFTNKIVPDYDTDPNFIFYDNTAGHAIVQGLSFSVNTQIKRNFNSTFGFIVQEVYEINENNTKEWQKHVPSTVFTGAVSYKIEPLNLTLDLTAKIVGTQLLPEYNEPYTRDRKSKPFGIYNIQATYQTKIKGLELYAGVKNLSNYSQVSPLVAADKPYSDDFDTAYIYGPLQGIRSFVGLRYTINQTK